MKKGNDPWVDPFPSPILKVTLLKISLKLEIGEGIPMDRIETI